MPIKTALSTNPNQTHASNNNNSPGQPTPFPPPPSPKKHTNTTKNTAEAKVLARLPPHPNVIALYGVCLWPQSNTVHLIIELASDTLENHVLRVS